MFPSMPGNACRKLPPCNDRALSGVLLMSKAHVDWKRLYVRCICPSRKITGNNSQYFDPLHFFVSYTQIRESRQAQSGSGGLIDP
jgi:hypothetical protein